MSSVRACSRRACRSVNQDSGVKSWSSVISSSEYWYEVIDETEYFAAS